MKRICCVLFAILTLCTVGCTGFDRLMTALDGNWREYNIDPASVDELMVYVPNEPELLSVTDRTEIEAFLTNAKQVSFHEADHGLSEASYVVKLYGEDRVIDIVLGGLPALYNSTLPKAADKLYERLKRGEVTRYQYTVMVPQGLYYDDATAYLKSCGYVVRNIYNSDRYPSLRLMYSVSDKDLSRYTDEELSRYCDPGTFAPDDVLVPFLEQLQSEGYYRLPVLPSEKQVSRWGSGYAKGTLLSVERGIRVYLTRFLSENEIAELTHRAGEASLTLEYQEPYSHVTLMPLSETPLSDEQLVEIETGLSALDNDDNLYEEADTSALLYEGEGLKIYYAYRQGEPGICVEAVNWSRTDARFLTLPFTEGLTNIVFTGVETKPDGDQEEALVYIHYLDDTGTERLICADHRAPEYTVVYPLSTGSSLVLNDEQRNLFNDLLLIGYMYTHFEAEKDRLNNPDNPGGWESLCQRRILDALYQNYNDTLPPYLKGEETIHSPYDGKITIITQEELEDFFQSTVGRPCLVQDRRHMYYDEPMEELLPGQVPMPETDYYCNGHVRQAVKEPDGTICLYGYRSGFEVMYESVICRIRPVDGYLGGQVVSTEVFPVYYIHNGPSIILAPIDNKN